MSDTTSIPDPTPEPSGRFGVTPWTDVVLAQGGVSPESREALERLCRRYWYPIYAHIRQHGHAAEDAEDLTQEFFALLIEKNFLEAADRRRGRFRSFLQVAINRFLVNAYRRDSAVKRGGRQEFVAIDATAAESRFELESTTELPPDKMFDRRWAEAVIDQALARLRLDYAEHDQAELFDHLRDFVLETTESRDYNQIAEQLGMKPGTVSVAVHRLRHRFREALAAEIRPTVANPDHVEAEMRHLVSALVG